jgi:hypothetical protein
MALPTGESNEGALRLNFDRRVMLQFRGSAPEMACGLKRLSAVTSDAGLLAHRELDDVNLPWLGN